MGQTKHDPGEWDVQASAAVNRIRPWMVVFGLAALLVAYGAGATPGWTQLILIAGALLCQGVALGAAARGGAIRQIQEMQRLWSEVEEAAKHGTN